MGVVMRKLLVVATVLTALLGGATAHAAPARTCQIVTDPAGDAALVSRDATGSTNDDALDVRSADIASGVRYLTAVVRVTRLGTAVDAGPRLDQWVVFFKFRGNGFVAMAQRALDGSQFSLAGDFPEQSATPGFTPTVQVKGSFDPTTNEVRIVFPRDLIGHTRAGDKITDIVVATYTGAGTLATQQTGAYAGVTVDGTDQPGPYAEIGRRSCVASP
jgi:hypothetical protein